MKQPLLAHRLPSTRSMVVILIALFLAALPVVKAHASTGTLTIAAPLSITTDKRPLTVSAAGVNKTYDGTSGASVILSTDALLGDDAANRQYRAILSFNIAALQAADFQATASKDSGLTFINNPVRGWYTRSLAAVDLPFVNKAGNTQFRLRFTKDDNNNRFPDYLKFFSGDAEETSQPLLIIQYYVP